MFQKCFASKKCNSLDSHAFCRASSHSRKVTNLLRFSDNSMSERRETDKSFYSSKIYTLQNAIYSDLSPKIRPYFMYRSTERVFLTSKYRLESLFCQCKVSREYRNGFIGKINFSSAFPCLFGKSSLFRSSQFCPVSVTQISCRAAIQVTFLWNIW